MIVDGVRFLVNAISLGLSMKYSEVLYSSLRGKPRQYFPNFDPDRRNFKYCIVVPARGEGKSIRRGCKVVEAAERYGFDDVSLFFLVDNKQPPDKTLEELYQHLDENNLQYSHIQANGKDEETLKREINSNANGIVVVEGIGTKVKDDRPRGKSSSIAKFLELYEPNQSPDLLFILDADNEPDSDFLMAVSPLFSSTDFYSGESSVGYVLGKLETELGSSRRGVWENTWAQEERMMRNVLAPRYRFNLGSPIVFNYKFYRQLMKHKIKGAIGNTNLEDWSIYYATSGRESTLSHTMINDVKGQKVLQNFEGAIATERAPAGWNGFKTPFSRWIEFGVRDTPDNIRHVIDYYLKSVSDELRSDVSFKEKVRRIGQVSKTVIKDMSNILEIYFGGFVIAAPALSHGAIIPYLLPLSLGLNIGPSFSVNVFGLETQVYVLPEIIANLPISLGIATAAYSEMKFNPNKSTKGKIKSALSHSVKFLPYWWGVRSGYFLNKAFFNIVSKPRLRPWRKTIRDTEAFGTIEDILEDLESRREFDKIKESFKLRKILDDMKGVWYEAKNVVFHPDSVQKFSRIVRMREKYYQILDKTEKCIQLLKAYPRTRETRRFISELEEIQREAEEVNSLYHRKIKQIDELNQLASSISQGEIMALIAQGRKVEELPEDLWRQMKTVSKHARVGDYKKLTYDLFQFHHLEGKDDYLRTLIDKTSRAFTSIGLKEMTTYGRLCKAVVEVADRITLDNTAPPSLQSFSEFVGIPVNGTLPNSSFSIKYLLRNAHDAKDLRNALMSLLAEGKPLPIRRMIEDSLDEINLYLERTKT